MDAAPQRLNRPPSSIEGWAGAFDPGSLPVLANTAELIESWRANEDAVDAHGLAQELESDPLMTIKLLALVAQRCRRPGMDRGGPETVTESLVMMGIAPFFRAFGAQTTVEQTLADQPAALAGLSRVYRRSHRAAAFAHEAALLHDLAELLLWLRAPALALEIDRRQKADPTLRSAGVQRELLQTTLPDLQRALMTRWQLPAALERLVGQPNSSDPRAVNVRLAVRVARHSALGWDNPALPDDVREIADLLQLGEDPTWRLLQDIDSTV
jgi:HD-like signal output (HDOD) protein